MAFKRFIVANGKSVPVSERTYRNVTNINKAKKKKHVTPQISRN